MSSKNSYNTVLNKQEINWILEQRVTRFTDNKEVLIYPMGAERYLSSVLSGHEEDRYNLHNEIKEKNVLIIPGYGNSAFLFAHAGAKSILVYDKDPVTIAWVKAFKKYYHYREYNNNGKPYPSIGELLAALTRWYPPLLKLPSGVIKNSVFWVINPKLLRKSYIYYMLRLTQQAVQLRIQNEFELDHHIEFYAGELKHLIKSHPLKTFDTVFVPYLLGVQNGIEKEKDIVSFIKQLIQLVPSGHILVTPARSTKEFHLVGQSYFCTTGYSNIQAIPELKPYAITEDSIWFKTQGLAVFGLKPPGAEKSL
ncbi:TPA: ABC transporter permease [Legionella pneumophila]